MSEIVILGLMILMWLQGYIVAYIFYAPNTPFKQGFIDGLKLKFLWRNK